MRRVRQVLRWAHRSGHLDSDPTAALVLPRSSNPTKALLTWEELQALLGAPDRSRPTGLRDAALFALLAETSLGLIGCLELVVNQERCLELEECTRALLEAYLKDGRPLLLRDKREKTLFLSRFGNPFGRHAAILDLARHAKAAGIRGQVTTLMLRRSYQAHLTRQAQIRHFSLNRDL
jgi:integrase/recombinase XerD